MEFFASKTGLAYWIYISASLILGGVILWALCVVPPKFRKPIVILVTFISGLYLSLEFLVQPPAGQEQNWFTRKWPDVSNVIIVIAAFALLIGTVNLLSIHGKALWKRRENWYNSLAFFIAFIAIMAAGFARDSYDGPVVQQTFNILFNGLFMPMQATMFSLIAFYIVSAAYRAFRIRTIESGLMMGAAAIIMLALVPVGTYITAWIPEDSMFAFLRLERIGYWILVLPNMAVQRAIAFGIAVGALATGLRIWLSLERGSFFEREL